MEKLTGKVLVDVEEYYQLLVTQEAMDMLEVGGVVNWAGYRDAMDPEGEEIFEDREYRIRREVIALVKQAGIVPIKEIQVHDEDEKEIK